jgi:DNA-binding IclR family transcriptional regulator
VHFESSRTKGQGVPSSEPAESREARGSLGTVRNAVVLLELLGEGPAFQQLTDLAERSGMSVPTVHRLLRSLVLADLAEQDPRSSRYSLGPELVRLSHRYLARMPVLAALGPYLAQLRELVGATVEVHALVRSAVVAIDRVDGPDAGLYRQPHAVTAPFASAAGRVLTSRASEEVWAAALEASSGPEREVASSERGAWASAAWLTTSGPELGAPGQVAVPLTDAHGDVLAALSAAVPYGASSDQVEIVAGHLARTGAAAVRTLGHA